jgi:hypothetical protein
MEFEMIGVLLGLAIYNSVILDVRFPSVVYRMLMGKKPSLADLKECQPELGKGLQQLLDFDGDVEGVFCRTFQVHALSSAAPPYEAFPPALPNTHLSVCSCPTRRSSARRRRST